MKNASISRHPLARRRKLFLEPLEARLALAASVFGVGAQQLVEGDSGTQEMVFTVVRLNADNDFSQTESIRYQVNETGNYPQRAEASRPDESLNDFALQSGELVFAPDVLSQEIRVVIRGDEHIEQNEQFKVRLSPDIQFYPPELLTYPHNPTEEVVDAAVAPAINVGAVTLLVTAFDASASDPHGLVRVLNSATGGGDFTFTSLGTLRSPGDAAVNRALAADIDGDGLGDVLIASSEGLAVHRGLAGQATSFDAGTLLAALGTYDVNDFALGDVNKDGLPDLVIADASSQLVYFANTSTSGSVAFASPEAVTLATAPRQVRLGDVTGDGVLDVVSLNDAVSQGTPNSLAILTGNIATSSPTFSVSGTVHWNGTAETADDVTAVYGSNPIQPRTVDLEMVDWNDDGLLDLALAAQDQSESGFVYAVFGNESNPQQNHVGFSSSWDRYRGGGAIGHDLAVADFNRDQLPDSAQLVNLQFPEIDLVQQGRFQSIYMPPGVGATSPSGKLATGDLNADGLEDLLAIHAGGGISWFRNGTNHVGLAASSVALGVIVDDDRPLIRLTQSRTTMVVGSEQQGVNAITAEIVGGSLPTTDLSIPLEIDAASTANPFDPDWPDFAISDTRVFIPFGQSSGSVTVTALPDDPQIVEPDETVVLRAQSSPLYRLESTSALTSTIVASVAPVEPVFVTLAANRNLVREPNGQIRLSVFASRPVSDETSVRIELVSEESTVDGNDWFWDSDIITIPAGGVQGSLLVFVADDAVFEPAEYLTFRIAEVLSGEGLFEGDNVASATILDDDQSQLRMSIDASAAAISEPNGVAGFVIQIDRPATTPITVSLAYSGAAGGADYTAPQTVTIPAGKTFALAGVVVVDDVTREPEETLTASISSVSTEVQISNDSATLSILDDDTPPVVRIFSVGSTSLGERDNASSIGYAALDTASAYDTVVRLGLAGTATLASDYTISSQTITIPAGQTLVGFAISTLADVRLEPTETIVVSIASIDRGAGDRILGEIHPSQSSFTLNLLDDPRPTLTRFGSTTIFMDEDATAQTTFNVENPLQATTPLTLRVTSSNDAILSPADVQIAFRSSTPRLANRDNRTLTIRPRPDQYGTVTLTVVAQVGSETVALPFTIHIRPVNDPPEFISPFNTSTFSLAPINEDLPANANPGTSVKAILNGSASPRPSNIGWYDKDGGASLKGIAVFQSKRTNGDWQYTVDGGVTWSNVVVRSARLGSTLDVAYTNTLLLPADDAEQARVRFLPRANYFGYSTDNSLAFLAWDQTTGSPGSFLDITRLTGEAATAFGNRATVVADVSSVNDRPELRLNSEKLTLPAINERQTANDAITEYSAQTLLTRILLAGGSYIDQETQFPGIVFTPLSNFTGYSGWQFNVGSGWVDANTFDDILLDLNGRVRYVGALTRGNVGNYSEPGPFGRPGMLKPKFEVRIWDHSFGSVGKSTISDANSQSGVSAAKVTFELPVNNINDRPEPEFGGEFRFGEALRSQDGIAVGQILDRYVLLYPQGERAFWREGVDEDSYNQRLGLALVNISPHVYLEVSYNSEPFQEVGLYGAAAAGMYVPIPLNARIRMVSRTGASYVTQSEYWAEFAFHDGDRDYRTPFYNPVMESANALRSYWAPIRIIALDPLEGTLAGDSAEAISPATLTAQAANSAEWWREAGLNMSLVNTLSAAQLSLADLPGRLLGLEDRGAITIDATAAGVTWFIDPTPDFDEEFELSASGELVAKASGPAAGKYDLLSVLAHEQGHMLGLEDDYEHGGLMGYQLRPGLRRRPTAMEVDALFADIDLR